VSSWERTALVAGVIVGAALVAKVIDRRLVRRQLAPETATRYRVLRRTVMSAVIALGVLSALFVIPQVRAVAGVILASGAVVGLVVGFAAQSTLANFVGGLLIAFTQPLRLGDRVEVGGDGGTVEEIGLTYTFIRTDDNARLVIPNAKLASDTIRNSSIRSREKLAEVTVQVPLSTDLDRVVELLRGEIAKERDGDVRVTALGNEATLTVLAWAPSAVEAEQLESELRRRVHARLRTDGVYA
jgi:small conductance mechanosensitive channel